MPEQDAPYDPYIPAAGSAAPAAGQQAGAAPGNARTQALQAVRIILDDSCVRDGVFL